MKYVLILSIVTFFIACDESQNNNPELASQAYTYELQNNNNEHPGKKLLESKCYACHNPTTSMEDRLAPPMIAVKKHYLSDEITQDDFTKLILNWVKQPVESNSKMPGALRRFGIMPYQEFSEEDIRKIAEYIFNNEIDQPIWFDEHYRQGRRGGMGRQWN